MDPTISPFPLTGVQMPAWMLRFDKHGACTSPGTREALLQRLHSVPPSDVIVFSHGWNNDFDDAAGMYADLMRRFEVLCAEHPPTRRFDPLFVGIVWPSIWLSFDDGPAIASSGLLGQADATLTALADQVAATGGAAALERIYALLAAPGIDDADAAELARLIAPAFGLVDDEGAAADGRSTVADDVLVMMRAMDAASPAARMDDTDDIDDFSRPAGAGSPTAAGSAQMAGKLQLLDPRTALRLFSIYQMKDRAGTVGFRGVSSLLRDLLGVHTQGGIEGPRIHLIGHSFGCKVLLSAICAAPLPRPIASLFLLQPAVSHLCFSESVPGTGRPGGYRAALLPERVMAPIFTTYSRRDVPLHNTFHLALRRAGDLGEAQIAADGEATSAGAPSSRYAALGGYGPRGAGQILVDPLPGAGDSHLPLGTTPIVAFDGSQGQIKGHGDITGPAIAWALHRLVFRN